MKELPNALKGKDTCGKRQIYKPKSAKIAPKRMSNAQRTNPTLIFFFFFNN